MSDVAPCLWVAEGADTAAEFYVSVFRDADRPASVGSVTRWGAGHAVPQDAVLMVELDLSGLELVILNGGQSMPSSPAISLIVKCRDQADVDHFWARLSDGGKPGRCGWLEDRYGVSWQVVPEALLGMIQDADPVRRGRAMTAFLPMGKLELATIRRAFEGDVSA